MKKYNQPILLLSLVLTGTLVLHSCGGNSGNGAYEGADHTTGEAAGHHDHSSNSAVAIRESLGENEVMMTGQQMETMGITLDSSRMQALANQVKVFGEVVLPPDHRATLSVVMDGIVKEIRVMEGDFVETGEILARIEHPAVADLQREYLEAAIRDTFLLQELERQERLRADSVNAEKTLQEVSSDYHSNKAHRRGLERKLAQLNLDPKSMVTGSVSGSYPLLAPISGYVGAVQVNTGMHVSASKGLLEITDNRQSYIDMAVYEQDFGSVETGQSVRYHLTGDPGKYWEGKVIRKSHRFNREARTARVHASMPETAGKELLPGMAVTAYIGTGGNEVRSLPETAFVLEQGRDYLFVLVRKETPGTEQGSHAHREEPGGSDPAHATRRESHDHKEHVHGQEPDDHARHSSASHEHDSPDKSYYIFRRVEVKKTISAGALSGFKVLRTEIPGNTFFVVDNAQVVQAELKRGTGGGHAHAH